MKKKLATAVIIVAAIILIGMIWYKTPVDLLNASPEDVSEIVVFNGGTGNETHITNRDDISAIVNSLNTIKMQRESLSIGYMGYGFKTTIYLSNDGTPDKQSHFIINSKERIRKDPFFYRVTEGSLDYEFIEKITD